MYHFILISFVLHYIEVVMLFACWTSHCLSGFATWQNSPSPNYFIQLSLWASYHIRKIAGCACAGNAGNVFPATDFKWDCKLAIPTCVPHVPWCMSELQTPGGGENVTPAFPEHAQPTILRIWQEAHSPHVIVTWPLPQSCSNDQYVHESLKSIGTSHLW